MSYSLCIQNTPYAITIAFCHDEKIIAQKTIDNHEACPNLISAISELLEDNQCSIRMCSYLAFTQGPAPFSSLRTVLATVHGIHIGTSIPLVGIDSLTLLTEKSVTLNHQYTVSLIDAFNKELYYAIKNIKTNEIITGCNQYQDAFAYIAQITDKKPTVIFGNGAYLYIDELKAYHSSGWIIPEPDTLFPSLEDTAQKGWILWNAGIVQTSLPLPLYLKKHAAERAKNTLTS